MKMNEAKTAAAELYARCNEVPGSGDFNFPSWLLCLSEPEKWGEEVLTDGKRARAALDDASYFAQVFEDGPHAVTAQEIQNGVYDLYSEYYGNHALRGEMVG